MCVSLKAHSVTEGTQYVTEVTVCVTEGTECVSLRAHSKCH